MLEEAEAGGAGGRSCAAGRLPVPRPRMWSSTWQSGRGSDRSTLAQVARAAASRDAPYFFVDLVLEVAHYESVDYFEVVGERARLLLQVPLTPLFVFLAFVVPNVVDPLGVRRGPPVQRPLRREGGIRRPPREHRREEKRPGDDPGAAAWLAVRPAKSRSPAGVTRTARSRISGAHRALQAFRPRRTRISSRPDCSLVACEPFGLTATAGVAALEPAKFGVVETCIA